jgi:hypothetical protein
MFDRRVQFSNLCSDSDTTFAPCSLHTYARVVDFRTESLKRSQLSFPGKNMN